MYLLGLIVSICYLPGITGAFIATQWAVLSMVLPIALFRSGPWTVFHHAGLWFLAYAVYSWSWSPAPYDSVMGLWNLFAMALTFWLGTTLPNLNLAIRGLAFGAVISSMIGIAQHFGIHVLPSFGPQPSGIYFNSVAQGAILTLVLVALICESEYILATLLLPGIVLSNSRGALLALTVGLAAFYIRRPWLLLAILLPGAMLLYLPVSPSDELRLTIWAILTHGLTLGGWGVGSLSAFSFPFHGQIVLPEFAHNDTLQLLFEYGAAGVIPIAILLSPLFRPQHRYWPVHVTFLCLGFYSFPLWIPITSFLGLLVAGNIIRTWALDGGISDHFRFDLLPRHNPNRDQPSLQPVPLVTPHPQ